MSKVWAYFEKCEDRTVAICKLCKKVVNRPVGNTTNLWKHYDRCNPKKSLVKPKGNTKVNSKESMIGRYPKRSLVWKYFSNNLGKQSSNCLKCKKEVRCKGGSTAGMWKHMQACHPKDKTLPLEFHLNPEEEIEDSSKKRQKPKSAIWRYFIKHPTSSNLAICLNCKKTFQRPYGNTTNLWVHQRKCLKDLMQEKNNHNKKDKETNCIESCTIVSKQSIFASETSTPKEQVLQSEVENNTEKHWDLVLSSSQDSSTTTDIFFKKIVKFLVNDLPPLTVICGSGFLNLVKEIKEASDLSPSFCYNFIDSVAKQVKTDVKISLGQSISAVSLSVQVAENRHQDKFMFIYANYIDPQISSSERLQVLLSFTQLPPSFSSEFLKDLFLEELNPWLCENDHCADFQQNVDDKHLLNWQLPVNLVLLDTNSDFHNVISNVPLQHKISTLQCFYTQLQHSVVRALESCNDSNVGTALQNARDLVHYFQQSEIAMERLHRAQVENGKPYPLQPVLDEKPFSTFQMLQGIFELKNEICILAKTSDAFCESITSTCWDVYLCLINILKPLDVALSYTNNSEIPIAEGIPIIQDLVSSLQAMISKNAAHANVIQELIKELENLSSKILADPNYLLSTFLHPSFRQKLSSDQAAMAILMLNTSFRTIHQHPLYKRSDDTAQTLPLTDQIDLYTENLASPGTNPICFWMECRRFWPQLSVIALNYLAVPLCIGMSNATVVNSPAVCCYDKRLGKTLQELVFLNVNCAANSHLASVFEKY